MTAIRRRISTPFSRVSGYPATVAEPEVGAISVPSVRTVVVFPAPFGPRKPKTSPWPISNERSANATRSPKHLPSPLTASAAGSGGAAGFGGAPAGIGDVPAGIGDVPAGIGDTPAGVAGRSSERRRSLFISHLIRKYITGTAAPRRA